jgi:hypothetical protein
MFEKIGRLAETAATKVSLSRRGFLGRLGQGALSAVGILGLLTLPSKALAGNKLYACVYQKKSGSGRHCYQSVCNSFSGQQCGGCQAFSCCQLISKTVVGTC